MDEMIVKQCEECGAEHDDVTTIDGATLCDECRADAADNLRSVQADARERGE